MDSPRGRIVLMKGLAEGTLEYSDTVVGHFDRCLGCMGCVTACPSGVKYDVLIEDTRELQSPAPDTVALRTRAGAVTMADLVRSTLRLRPDRIIVGEVRGGEALDMLKAWNTGHPGGIATVHANSAKSALYRIEQLVQEAVVTVPRRLIAEAIDLIVFISGRGLQRRVASIARVAGVDPDGGYGLVELLDPDLSLTPQGE
jgi:type IV secretion system protein VirB11